MNEPKIQMSDEDWDAMRLDMQAKAAANGRANLTGTSLIQQMEEARRRMWKDPFATGYDPREQQLQRSIRYEQEKMEGVVRDMVRRGVRAELDRMNSTRTAMVQLEVCAEGGFTVVHNGAKYACADTQAMTERIVAITAVMALEQMDKEKS